MAGVGKLMKQAAKMQKKMQELQEQLSGKEIVVQSGGGAVGVKISLQQEIRGIELDPEFLKEDKGFVEETLVEAIRAAYEESRSQSEAAMSQLAESMQIPGLPNLF